MLRTAAGNEMRGPVSYPMFDWTGGMFAVAVELLKKRENWEVRD